MATLGNLWLGLALACYVFPWVPDFPRVRAAIMRPRFNPIGPVYVLFFVLIPRFLRALLVAIAVWNFLGLALAACVHRGALAWTGFAPGVQYGLVGAGCGLMIVVLLGKTLLQYDVTYRVPAFVRPIMSGLRWGAPVVVAVFALLALNPALTPLVPPAVLRGALVLVAGLALIVASVLVWRWLKPLPVPAAPVVAKAS